MKITPPALALAALGLLLAGGTVSAVVGPERAIWPFPAMRPGMSPEIGLASWYGPGFHGRTTASGEVFDQNDLTAAHRELPLGTRVRVTNLANGQSVDVVVNDRGPYIDGRVIDLSKAAAGQIEMVHQGIAQVRVDVLEQPRLAYLVRGNDLQ